MSSASGDGDREPPAKRARVRQACQACRDAKLRCDLGDPGEPKDPPCQRCSRSGRECRFVGSHLHHKPRKMTYRKSTSASASGEQARYVVLQAKVDISARKSDSGAERASVSTSPQVENRASVSSAPTVRSPYHGGINFGETIETPADALRVLVAAADEESTAAAVPHAHLGDGKIWNQWAPVRDGLLTTEEARSLLTL